MSRTRATALALGARGLTVICADLDEEKAGEVGVPYGVDVDRDGKVPNAVRPKEPERQRVRDPVVVADADVIREWIVTNDNHTRPDHREMAGTKLQGMSAPFILPDGSRMMLPA